MPRRSLAIDNGDAVVPVINELCTTFDSIILTQDWHPANHFSFTENHSDRNPFETITAEYGEQTLWPVHYVQGTSGSAFHPDLDTSRVQIVIRKGFRVEIDSYSAFFENDQRTTTGLCGYLKDRRITDLVFAGLATDYCVAWSAIDAVKLGFSTKVMLSACLAIDLDGSLEKQIKVMKNTRVVIS